MKQRKSELFGRTIISIIITSSFMGCVTTTPVPPKDTPDIVVPKESREAEYKLLKLTTFLYKDSEPAVFDYYEYSYNAEGVINRQTEYDSFSQLKGYYHYEYNSEGFRSKKSIFNEAQDLQEIITYEYDDKGNLLEEAFYNGLNKLTRSRVYDYGEIICD